MRLSMHPLVHALLCFVMLYTRNVCADDIIIVATYTLLSEGA